LKTGAFFGELKRRNVLRAGAFYAAAIWALALVKKMRTTDPHYAKVCQAKHG
jgi:hypothetical protein